MLRFLRQHKDGKMLMITAFSWLLTIMPVSNGFTAEEGLKWERFRLLPALSVSESCTDNVYLTSTDTRNDSITTIAPNIRLDFALAPQHYISARYDGAYRLYHNSENFREYSDQAGLSWSLTAPQSSTIKVDATTARDSIQPFSSTDIHKDFVKQEVYVDTVIKSLTFMDVAFRYDHLSRRFKDAQYSPDDFDSDTVTAGAIYRALPSTGFLAEYTYYHQNNMDRTFPDLETHVVLVGAQWEATAKLTGHLKLGYYFTTLNNQSNSSGFAVDTDLAYKATDVSRLTVAAFRRLIRSTFTDRETGEYYISTGGAVSAAYSRWTPVTFSADASYTKNEFSQTVQDRSDELWAIGASVRYAPRDRLSITVGYRYRNNDSTVLLYNYRESRGEARLLFAL